MNELVAIVGPTAVGKSRLALELAPSLNAEIVNADSRQVYRYLDIGTAKPSQEEQGRVPHHLIDILDPDQPFSLALYQSLATQAIRDIQSRGKLPLLVGGSGLYVWAVLEGYALPRVPPNGRLREELRQRAESEGALALHRELASLDPQAAARIDPRNLRRVIRALEVCQATGEPFSPRQGRQAGPYRTLILGLILERPQLYQRIDRRVEGMVQRGLVEEVRGLLALGYSPHLSALSGVGYRQVCLYLQGALDLETAVARIKAASHRFARQQYAWFRLTDPRIRWLKAQAGVAEEAAQLIAQFCELSSFRKLPSLSP